MLCLAWCLAILHFFCILSYTQSNLELHCRQSHKIKQLNQMSSLCTCNAALCTPYAGFLTSQAGQCAHQYGLMLIRYHLKRHLLLPPAFRAVADAQVVALETFTRLENLSMDGCIAMTSIALNLPFLRHVSLEGCVALTQVCLPPIHVSYCYYYILLYFISLLFIYCFVVSCDWLFVHVAIWHMPVVMIAAVRQNFVYASQHLCQQVA